LHQPEKFRNPLLSPKRKYGIHYAAEASFIPKGNKTQAHCGMGFASGGPAGGLLFFWEEKKQKKRFILVLLHTNAPGKPSRGCFIFLLYQ